MPQKNKLITKIVYWLGAIAALIAVLTFIHSLIPSYERNTKFGVEK